MNKLKFFGLFFFTYSVLTQAQTSVDSTLKHAIKLKQVSISYGISSMGLPLRISKEDKLDINTTFISSASLNTGVAYSSTYGGHIELLPTISGEYRLYYGVKNTLFKKKKIIPNNTFNYFALKAICLLPLMYDEGFYKNFVKHRLAFALIPLWGWQASMGKKMIFYSRIGFGAIGGWLNNEKTFFKWLPLIDVGFSHVIK